MRLYMLLAGGRSRIQYRCTILVCTTACVFAFARQTRKNYLHCSCRTVRVTPDSMSNACSAPFLVSSSSLRPPAQACVSFPTRVWTLCFHLPDSSYIKAEDACVGLVCISVVCCVATTPPLTLERLFVGRSYLSTLRSFLSGHRPSRLSFNSAPEPHF